MAKFSKQDFRITLLALTLAGIVWVLFKLIVAPAKEATASSVQLPETVPLPKWQLIDANPLTAVDNPQLMNGQRYQYRRKGDRLDVEVRYEANTDGNVSRLLVVYTPIQPATVSLAVKHRQEIGYYSIFYYKRKAYLSACINSQGISTVTEAQFFRNKYTQALSLNRMLSWIIGQQDLFEGNCLWSLLSTSVEQDSHPFLIDVAFWKLETTWFDWYRWWKSEALSSKLIK